MAKATFAAGCFWGIQEEFDKIIGVKTTVGYCGGKTKNPTYEEVCSGKTNHAESIEIIYNPKKISYEKLLETFWKIHDPTQVDRQGLDIGTQYRSVIFYHNQKQKELAIKSKKEQQNNNIVTQIKKAPTFYKAEEYHQKYYKKH